MSESYTIASLKEGDEIAFGEIFKNFHEKVYFYILSKTNSNYIAAETTQLTFIKLWQYRSSLIESIPLSAQLFRIAKTTFIDILRVENNKAKLLNSQKYNRTYFTDIQENLETEELRQKLLHAIENMPPVRKKVFELSRNEGLSYREISEILSVSVKTVENHISLALKQLRHFLTLLPATIVFLFF
jgi:RNA polymerase sigma-70 factor (ECF subfamily)